MRWRKAIAGRWSKPHRSCGSTACRPHPRSKRWRPCCNGWQCFRPCRSRPTQWMRKIPRRQKPPGWAPPRRGAGGGVDGKGRGGAKPAGRPAAGRADETHLLYSLCLHGRGELGLAPDEYAALTMVLLRLLAFKPGGAPSEKKSLRQPEAAPSGAVPVSVPVPAPTPAPTPAPAAAASTPADPVAPAQTIAPALLDPAGAEKSGASAVQPAPLQNAPEFVAIPVRVTPEPGARLQPTPHCAPMPVSERYTPTEEGDIWHATVQQLLAAEAITALARELALQSQLLARDD